MNPDYDIPGQSFYPPRYDYDALSRQNTYLRGKNDQRRADNARLLEENRQLREKLEQASDFAKISSVTQALSTAGCSGTFLARAKDVMEALEARGWTFTQV